MMRHGDIIIANGDVQTKYTGSYVRAGEEITVRYREESGEAKIVLKGNRVTIERRNSIVPVLTIETGVRHPAKIVMAEGTVPFETLGESVEYSENETGWTAEFRYRMIQGDIEADSVSFRLNIIYRKE